MEILRFSMVLLLLTAFLAAVAAQSTSDCSSKLTPVVSCLGYVQGTEKSPSKECCAGLATIVKDSPVCLCTLVSGNSGTSLPSINTTRALEMPALCNVKGADAKRCAALLAPTGSPKATGPSPSMDSGGSVPQTSSPLSGKSGTHSGGISMMTPSSIFLLGVLWLLHCVLY